MIYEVAALVALAQQCAPEVATEAVVPLVVTESGGDPLALNINRGPPVRAHSVSEGVRLAQRYVAAGYTVDIGLAQVNSANFARLGVTPEQVFDPCTNLRLASTLLQEGYGRARRHYSGLDAISATYSLYNTGTLTRGLRNGYVNRVWAAASTLGAGQPAAPQPGASVTESATAVADGVGDDMDRWVVGQVASGTVQVFR